MRFFPQYLVFCSFNVFHLIYSFFFMKSHSEFNQIVYRKADPFALRFILQRRSINDRQYSLTVAHQYLHTRRLLRYRERKCQYPNMCNHAYIIYIYNICYRTSLGLNIRHRIHLYLSRL